MFSFTRSLMNRSSIRPITHQFPSWYSILSRHHYPSMSRQYVLSRFNFPSMKYSSFSSLPDRTFDSDSTNKSLPSSLRKWVYLVVSSVLIYANADTIFSSLSSIHPKIGSAILWWKGNGQHPLFDLRPSESILTETSLETDLMKVLTSQRRCVRVINLPPGAGKSCTIDFVLHNLQKEGKIGQVLHVPCDEIIEFDYTDILLRQKIFPFLYWPGGVSLGKYLQNAALFSTDKPFVVYLDNFDRAANRADAESFITSMGEEALRTSSYIVIVSVRNPYTAKKVVEWNGREKIKNIATSGASIMRYRWPETRIVKLIKTRLSHEYNIHISENQIREAFAPLIKYGTIAGTPGFVLTNFDDYVKKGKYNAKGGLQLEEEDLQKLKADAEVIQQEWESCKEALPLTKHI